jgi:hypothetical protein
MDQDTNAKRGIDYPIKENTARQGGKAEEHARDYEHTHIKDVTVKEIKNNTEFQSGHGPDQGTSD